MASNQLSTPTIEVNNNIISIVPNSFKYKSGAGERTVKTQSSGGSSVEIVVAQNAETFKSMVSFDMFTTDTNIDLIQTWQTGLGTNSILASDNSAGVGLAFDQMTVTNDPEITMSQDGTFTVEMEGAALV